MTDSETAKHTNLLLGETSPYLLQHAHNPVDWHPWGAEAIDRAKAEDKPIFLSIGYSACHWCHVMERESFENEEIARVLNERFISIKVDREERPDVDDLYMQAVQMMTGRGGWPMSVFLTPQLEPFFGGTYFPPEDGARGPGFRSLLLRLSEAYRQDREKIAESAKQILATMAESADAAAGERGEPGLTMLEGAAADLRRRFDSIYGGFSSAPKFPPSMALAFLLAEHLRTGDLDLLMMVETTLDKMARGGLYDQLGGGFHRYSTDHRWLAPHFEKMLYDNALLAPIYFDASLLAESKFYEQIGRGVLDYVLGEMTDEAGGYYSTEDADSEGVEGKFYLWDRSEVLEALGDEEGRIFCDFYDVSDTGNFEGRNILNVVTPLEEFATRHGEPVDAIEARLTAAREILLARRRARVHPGKDDKILTAWNGMMISAMARGAQVTGDERYRASAERAANFVLENLRDDRGGLLRIYRGGRAKIAGFLDDYAFFATGLIDLYQTTFEPRWLETAAGLAEKAFELFYDREGGGFFIGDGGDPTVLIRRKDTYDGATPSGNSAATLLALRLSILLDRPDYREIAMRSLESMNAHLHRMPGAVHHLLASVQRVLAAPEEIAIIGDPAAPETRALVRAVWTRFLPGREIAAAAPGEATRGFNAKIALLKDKLTLGEKPTAYVCENYACKKPVTDVEEFVEQLR